MQTGLLPVELRDDGTQEGDVVLLDLVHIARIGYAQTQRRAVELERDDGQKPLGKLLLGRLLFDAVKTVLPYIAICLRVV